MRWIEYGLARDPDNWILHQRRGMYLLRGGLIEDAAADFDRAARLGNDGFPRAWSAAVARLRGEGSTEDLAAALGGLSPRRRQAFLGVLRRVVRNQTGGRELVQEVADIVKAWSLPRTDAVPALSDEIGRMDRSPAAVMRARAIRDRARAAHAPKPASPFRTSKEHVFARLLAERREARLEV